MRHPEDEPKTMILMEVDLEPGERQAHQAQEGAHLLVRAGLCLLLLSWTSPSGAPRERPCVQTWAGVGASVARPVVPGCSLRAVLPSGPVLEVCAPHGGWMFPWSLHCLLLAASHPYLSPPPHLGQREDHSNMGHMNVPSKHTGAGQGAEPSPQAPLSTNQSAGRQHLNGTAV